jgi:hypothetical protein
MTEKEIQLLGFQREESIDGFDEPFYYYTYRIADGLEFISCANDEVKEDEEWYVDIFNTDPHIRFTEFGDVQGLINILEKRKVKK